MQVGYSLNLDRAAARREIRRPRIGWGRRRLYGKSGKGSGIPGTFGSGWPAHMAFTDSAPTNSGRTPARRYRSPQNFARWHTVTAHDQGLRSRCAAVAKRRPSNLSTAYRPDSVGQVTRGYIENDGHTHQPGP